MDDKELSNRLDNIVSDYEAKLKGKKGTIRHNLWIEFVEATNKLFDLAKTGGVK